MIKMLAYFLNPVGISNCNNRIRKFLRAEVKVINSSTFVND
jgi:hypothetical protein